jgi:hypothetical protein
MTNILLKKVLKKANPVYGLARPSHQINACIGITSFIFKLLYLGIKKAHPSLG